MIFKIKSSSNIVNFPNLDGNSVFSSKKMQDFLNELTKNIFVDPEVSNWTILFNILFVKGSSINIYLRGFLYPKDKEKEITIQIPIPTKEQISWGIEETRFAVRPPIDKKKFLIIPVNFCEAKSLIDFIDLCVKEGLKAVLENGITLKGFKIKMSSVSDRG